MKNILLYFLVIIFCNAGAQTVQFDSSTGSYYALITPIQLPGFSSTDPAYTGTYVTRLELGKFFQQSGSTISVPYYLEYATKPKQYEVYYQGRISVNIPGNLGFDSIRIGVFRYLQAGGTINGFDNYLGFQFTYQ